MKFFVPMAKIPTATDQEKGINTKTKQIFLKPAAKEARASLRAHLSPFKPDHPFSNVPIAVRIIWCFPVTKGHTPGDPKITRPDTQNLNKALYDVMTELGFWDDDSRICEEHIYKVYSDVTGLSVSIHEIPMFDFD